MTKTMTLKYAGTCTECGVRLPKGITANWTGRGRVECIDCNDPDANEHYEASEPLGLTLSRHDRYGVYNMSGDRLGSTCSCEDYPCCGH